MDIYYPVYYPVRGKYGYLPRTGWGVYFVWYICGGVFLWLVFYVWYISGAARRALRYPCGTLAVNAKSHGQRTVNVRSMLAIESYTLRRKRQKV